jgi:three-Cys-motif partner protein
MTKNTPAISQSDGLIVRPSGPWIKKKYHYLKCYCDIFTKAMSKRWAPSALTFIDLFAGPGRCYIKESKEDLEGSSLIALQYGFSDYIFVEQDKVSLNALKTRCQNSPKRNNVSFIGGDCNLVVDHVIQKLHPQGLALAFIDPTKINITFETVKRLVKGRRIDLLINIQDGMDIKRNFARYKEQGDPSRLGEFLGGNVPWSRLSKPSDAVDLYKNRIKDLGYKTVEFKDIPVYNTNNAPMYFLFFASKHPRGTGFWKKITTKDDQGQMEFI